ncbi:hypothetical protein [Acinetobacter baumannii]
MVFNKRTLALLIGTISLSAHLYANNTTVKVSQTPIVSSSPIPLVKANAIEQYYINVKHRFNGAEFEQPPRKIKRIKLNLNVINNGEVVLTAHEADKSKLENYLQQNPKNSELLASYVARMINYNHGYTVPENKGKYSKYASTTVYEALLDELNYNFATTPVVSVDSYASQQQLESVYLYILSRLDPQEKAVFWQFVNTYKVGDKIEIPEGTVIADVLNTYKIQLNFKAP